MSTDAQISANRANSQHSTGPRTGEGKAASSRNGLTLGLFTRGDYVRDEEFDEYRLMRDSFAADFNPQTTLEHTYVAAILSAAWRLRRCSEVEFRMSGFFGLDPMEDQAALPIQTSVDRARGQSFNILRRSTTELRRLQTDRALRTSDTNDLVSQIQIVSTLAHAKRPAPEELASYCSNTSAPAVSTPSTSVSATSAAPASTPDASEPRQNGAVTQPPVTPPTPVHPTPTRVS